MPVSASQVQSANASSTGQIDVAPAWPAPTTAGNLLVAVIGLSLVSNPGAPAITPPSDWLTAGTAEISNAANCRTHIFYIENAATRSGTETFSWQDGDFDINDCVAVLIEWSGLTPSGALDQSANASGTSSGLVMPSGTTGTTSQADELAIAAICNRNVTTQSSPTNSFVQIEQAQSPNATTSNRVNLGVYAKVLSSTGAQSMQVSMSGATQRPYTSGIVTFEGSQVSGVPRGAVVAPSSAAIRASSW